MGLWSRFKKKTVPKIYSKKDANYFVKASKDPNYDFGSDYRDDPDLEARIFSVKPEDFREIRSRLREAKRVHFVPMIFGHYNTNSRTFRFNDFPWEIISFAALPWTAVFFGLHGFYYLGRRSVWRHEGIHARHHYNIKEYLRKKRGAPSQGNSKETLQKDFTAAELVMDESSLEELLTRWQSVREARGPREKLFASGMLAEYLPYAPFLAIKHLYNSAVNSIDEKNRGLTRRSFGARIGFLTPPLPVLFYLVFANLPLPVMLPVLSITMFSYIALLSGAFLDITKFQFLAKYHERGIKTDQFPYTSNPLKSLYRSVKLVRYLGKVWDVIPSYRTVSRPSDLEAIRKEVSDRLRGKLNEKQYATTMHILDDALSTVQLRSAIAPGQLTLPQLLYLKGQFIGAFYLRSKELLT